jgi:phenylacetate-CoA ligase
MFNLIGRATYRAIDRVRGEGILPKLRKLLVTQFQRPDEIRKLQEGKLNIVLRCACERVPFYRERIRQAGLRPDDLERPDALSEIPVLTKKDIQDAGDSILYPEPSEKYRWEITSGSTGTPLRCRRSLDSYGWHRANNLRNLSWFGVRPGERQARVWGVPIEIKERRREQFRDFMLNRRRISAFGLDESDLEKSMARLRAYAPMYLYGYPSAIHALARHVLAEPRSQAGGWRPQVVMTTAEMLFEDQLLDIGKAFRCPVAGEYGASELTVMASTCPEGTLHLNDESIITEYEATDLIIDDQPAYRLIFTDLNNLSMPMIRYSIGDLGRPLKEPCPCGRGLGSLKILGGREVVVLRTPSGKRIHGSIFSYLGKSILIRGGILHFRAVQNRPDLLEIEIVKGASFRPDCLQELEKEVEQRTSGEIRIRFLEVPRIIPESSGKLRYFISNLDQAGT